MSAGIKSLAHHLQKMGRGKDTILAHIMPEEAALLKAHGGSGTINPKTGLMEFLAESDASYGGGGYGYGQSNYGSGGGGDTSGGWSTGYSGGGGGGTGTGKGGGSALSGFTGSGPSPSGTGGGMLTEAAPAATSTGGGNWTPSLGGGNNTSNYLQSIGVPTAIKDAVNTAGTSLLNFSDWSSGVISNAYSNPTQTLSNIMSALTPSMPSAPAVSTEPWTGGMQVNQPQIFGSFDTNAPATPVNTYAAQDLQLGPLSTVNPLAPTAANNAYNATYNNEGLTADDAALRQQQFNVTNQAVFDDYAGRTTTNEMPDLPYSGFDVTPDLINRQINAPAPQPSAVPETQFAQNIGASLEATFNSLGQPSSNQMPLPTFAQVSAESPMAFPETGVAPTYSAQPQAPSSLMAYSEERMTNPEMQPQSLREAISNPSLYYGMGYPSLVNMPNPTQAGVAGMLANINRESSYNPAEYNPQENAWGFAQYQRDRLPGFLAAMGVSPNASKEEIAQALQGTGNQQIGYMLNEIATTPQYAPTYAALTHGVTPGSVATTYMNNFEGAQMVPSRVAAQETMANKIFQTAYAGLTLPYHMLETAVKTGSLTKVLEAAMGSSSPAETQVASAEPYVPAVEEPTYSYGGGGGDNSFGGGSKSTNQMTTPTTPSEPPVTPEPTPEPPISTLGLDLTRRVYNPNDFAYVDTTSPAYS